MTFEDFEAAVHDLRPNGLDFSGTCPSCGSNEFAIRIYGEHEFEPVCPNCNRFKIEEAVQKIVGRNGVNGHEPYEDPPPPREPPPEPRAERVMKFPLISFDELRSLPPPTWQVEDFFLEETLVQIFGETNHGKSLLVWDLSCSICLEAETWFGRKILKYGPVVWINADGGRGLTLRANAWAEANGGNLKHPLLTLMGSVHLNQAQQISAFRRQLLAMDPRPVLVVFDTQSRCMPGGDENDQGTMTQVTEGMHRIKMEVGCTVLPIHHTDKTGQWERGSGVVKNETDAQIRVSKDEKSGIFTVHCRKIRDGLTFKDFYFKLKPVGDSVVIVQEDAPPPETPTEKKISKQAQMFNLVRNEPGITYKISSARMNVSEDTAERYADALVKAGLIRREMQGSGESGGRPHYTLWITDQGRLSAEVYRIAENDE